MNHDCPDCGCPFFSGSGYRTADVPRAWQDEDGTWYKGPAKEEWTQTCDGCGYTRTYLKEHGKLVKTTCQSGKGGAG